NAGNPLLQELLPVNRWGTQVETVPFATRGGGDLVRVLAGTDGTHVSINGTVVATLNHGKFFETDLTTAADITSDQPVEVMQYSHSQDFDHGTGDPSMMIVPSVDAYASSYTFTNNNHLPFNINYVNLVVPQADVGAVTLDGTTIAASSFTAIGSGGFL